MGAWGWFDERGKVQGGINESGWSHVATRKGQRGEVGEVYNNINGQRLVGVHRDNRLTEYHAFKIGASFVSHHKTHNLYICAI